MPKNSVFLNPSRAAQVREELFTGKHSRVAALESLRQQAAEIPVGKVPSEWFVPWYYVEPDAHRVAKASLMNSANAAYAGALLHLLDPSQHDAGESLRQIEAWCHLRRTRRDQDSRLCYSYHFPALIFAASMLHHAGSLSSELDDLFSTYIREQALPMATVEKENNWGNWGLVLQSAIGSYLEDPDLLSRSAQLWKELLLSQVADDGHLPHEIGRNDGNGDHGIWYSHFSLMPHAIAGEILENAGFPVFAFETERLSRAFQQIAQWSLDPSTFPFYKKECGKPLVGLDYIGYFEILQPRIPNAAAAALLEKKRPVVTVHSVLGLTLTAGDLD